MTEYVWVLQREEGRHTYQWIFATREKGYEMLRQQFDKFADDYRCPVANIKELADGNVMAYASSWPQWAAKWTLYKDEVIR